MEGTQKEIERVRDSADRVRLLLVFVDLVGIGIGIFMSAQETDSVRAVGVALIVVCVLLGLLTWLAAIILDTMLERPWETAN